MLLTAMIACLNLAASCASTPDTGSTYPPRGGDYERPRRLPRDADLVREGVERVRWTADLNGEVYVYDVQAERIDYTGSIRRNQEIVVEPGSDRVLIDGRVVQQANLNRNNQHQIFFARERIADNNRGETPPRGSRRLAEGKGRLTLNRVADDGTMCIFDETDRKIMFEQTVHRGQKFELRPHENRVLVNDKEIAEVRFDENHQHSFYFR
jgi:hypothetical protein